MLNVCISPTPDQIKADNGVGQVVHAQYRELPTLGIDLVDDPAAADVVACHIVQGAMPRVDVLHCHGLYFDDIDHAPYERWHLEANQLIAAAARQAHAVTVPSDWVAEPFRRDMRITPWVIGHGVDLDAWPVGQSKGYALWNKNRPSDVCSPLPAYQLAQRGANVVSTFAPVGAPLPPSLTVVGVQPHDKMRQLVRGAEVYLATTRETFGIGTLEALAAGVPVLGYRYGGTAELIEHQVSGYLATPGDDEDLWAGYQWLRDHPEVRQAARERAAAYSWRAVCARYAELYQRVARERATENQSVSIVITNYNYGGYVGEAIESCLSQTEAPAEIIVVDDGSTDGSLAAIQPYADRGAVRLLAQPNQGVAAARNTGIAAAVGAFIVCLDADDRLAPDYTRVSAAALRADRGLGVAYSGLGLITPSGIQPNAWPPDFAWEAQSTPANPPSNTIPCAAMFRRSMWARVGGYKQVYAPAEDTEFFTRGLASGFTARRVTAEPLFEYRVHEGSASRTKVYKPIDLWHPWMRDRQYPFAAPSAQPIPVRSYADPLISVVIPCGPGHAGHVATAIESVLGQTFRRWELIVVPNGGADPDLSIYPFVRVAHADTGPAEARNAGAAAATAPLLLYLDADDYLLPDALRALLQAYVESGGKYIYSDWLALRNGELEAHETDEYRQAGWLERGQHAITALIETAHVRGVGGFDERMRGWEDWDFFIKLAISGVCGQRVAQPLLVYRQDTGTVREASLANKDELLATLKDRYAAYAWGSEPMSSCCGGNADTILAAKAALERANGPAAAWLPQPVQAANTEAPVVRLRFTGPQRGGVTYKGRVSGRSYVGGDNPMDKYADVDPRDVEHLLLLGVWEVVSQPSVAIAVPPPPAPIAMPAPAAPPAAAAGERPMLDLAGDMPAELEAQVNQVAQQARREMRNRG